jgi:acyl-CoA thioester hydrolase
MSGSTPPPVIAPDLSRAERDVAKPAMLIYLRPRFSDLDPLGHVNNAVYVNLMEQAAIDHAAALGLGQSRLAALGGVFIARRHLIEFLQPALSGDRLRILTWVEYMHGARAFRRYEVQRQPGTSPEPWPLPDRTVRPGEVPSPFGDVILRARTEWAYVDVATGRPKRMPPPVLAVLDLAPLPD